MLSDIIKPENVVMDLESSDKDSLFAELLESLVRTNPQLNRDEIIQALFDREGLKNTCIMKGIAVPHCSASCVGKPLVALGLSGSGVDYEVGSEDLNELGDGYVHLVILILFEQGNAERHLHVLADCARVLHVPGFYEAVLKAETPQDVCNLIREFETEF